VVRSNSTNQESVRSNTAFRRRRSKYNISPASRQATSSAEIGTWKNARPRIQITAFRNSGAKGDQAKLVWVPTHQTHAMAVEPGHPFLDTELAQAAHQ